MRYLQQDITKLQSLLQEHSDCFPPSHTIAALQASHASDRLVNRILLQVIHVDGGSEMIEVMVT